MASQCCRCARCAVCSVCSLVLVLPAFVCLAGEAEAIFYAHSGSLGSSSDASTAEPTADRLPARLPTRPPTCLQFRGDIDDRMLTEAVAPLLESLAACPDVAEPLARRFSMQR